MILPPASCNMICQPVSVIYTIIFFALNVFIWTQIFSSGSGVLYCVIFSLIFQEGFILVCNSIIRNNTHYLLFIWHFCDFLSITEYWMRQMSFWEIHFLLREQRQKQKKKKLGAHQPKEFKIRQNGKNQYRLFSTSWFDEKRWLTVSEQKKAFFCFVCVLFAGGSNCAMSGTRDLKHLSEWRYEASVSHIKFNRFGFV